MENSEYVGVGARFGPTLESKEKRANLSRVVMADPPDCCTKPKNMVFKLVIKLENVPNVTLLACEA